MSCCPPCGECSCWKGVSVVVESAMSGVVGCAVSVVVADYAQTTTRRLRADNYTQTTRRQLHADYAQTTTRRQLHSRVKHEPLHSRLRPTTTLTPAVNNYTHGNDAHRAGHRVSRRGSLKQVPIIWKSAGDAASAMSASDMARDVKVGAVGLMSAASSPGRSAVRPGAARSQALPGATVAKFTVVDRCDRSC